MLHFTSLVRLLNACSLILERNAHRWLVADNSWPTYGSPDPELSWGTYTFHGSGAGVSTLQIFSSALPVALYPHPSVCRHHLSGEMSWVKEFKKRFQCWLSPRSGSGGTMLLLLFCLLLLFSPNLFVHSSFIFVFHSVTLPTFNSRFPTPTYTHTHSAPELAHCSQFPPLSWP